MYRVLLVDDERMILEGLSRVVPWKDLSCEVTGTAPDGKEGLEMVRALRPHILFTDIRMPNVDGLAMIAAIRSEFPGIQISVLTAYRDFDYARRALNLGVIRYLLKPSRMPELLEAVQAMTGKLEHEKALYASFFDLSRSEEENRDTETETPAEPSSAESGNYIVRMALDYMRRSCGEHLSLSAVAEKVYVSQWHLSKLLNRYTGKSFFDLLCEMRMEHAAEMLKDPSMKIYTVAEAVGYSDVANFSRSFKKVMGKTPGEYRDDPDKK